MYSCTHCWRCSARARPAHCPGIRYACCNSRWGAARRAPGSCPRRASEASLNRLEMRAVLPGRASASSSVRRSAAGVAGGACCASLMVHVRGPAFPAPRNPAQHNEKQQPRSTTERGCERFHKSDSWAGWEHIRGKDECTLTKNKTQINGLTANARGGRPDGEIAVKVLPIESERGQLPNAVMGLRRSSGK